MARPITDDFQRITFSLPKVLVARLKAYIEKGQVSGFVKTAIEEKMDHEVAVLDKFDSWYSQYVNENMAASNCGDTAAKLVREQRTDRTNQIIKAAK